MSVTLREEPSPLVTTRYGVADDHARVADLHSRCSDHTLFRRFHAPLPRTSDTLARRLLQPENGWSLVAEVDADLVAMACAGPLSNLDLEVGILVQDSWQGSGLGSLLLGEIAAEAAARGYRALRCLTQPDNHAVLGTARKTGLSTQISSHDGLMIVAMPLDRAAPAPER